MRPEESRALAQFCADQYYDFDPRAWKRRGQYDHNASTFAALHLSTTDWYGHESELEDLAADARALSEAEGLRRADQDGAFDVAQFIGMVRSEIAARHIPPTVMRPGREQRSAA